MITIEDLRNPERKSGFDRVGVSHGGSVRKKPYSANWRVGKKVIKLQRRATAEEAAQDYCNYANSGYIAVTRMLRTAGHKRVTDKKQDKHPKLVAADRLRREALAEIEDDPRGYVYLVGEEGSSFAVKVGKSGGHPANRLPELQTGNPRKLILLGFREVPDRAAAERALHVKYIKDNELQEWFKPSAELFAEFGLEFE